MKEFNLDMINTVTWSYDGKSITHNIDNGMDAYSYTAMVVINQQEYIDDLKKQLEGAIKTSEMLVAYKNQLLEELDEKAKGDANNG